MLLFYTDPHLGLARASNTTPSSAKALQNALFKQALAIVRNPDVEKICLGDMLDRFSNPEEVQLQAMTIMMETCLVLAGNHDVVNQADKLGTLQFLCEVMEDLSPETRCVTAKFGEPMFHVEHFHQDNIRVVSVPHVANQDLFEQSLKMAEAHVASVHAAVYNVLCLHCNFDMPEERLTETSLNLFRPVAERLLKSFHYVLLGHEHAPSEHYDGRLIIIGNTHPTGMADISDKRVIKFDQGMMMSEKVWDMSTGYAEYDCTAVPERTQASFVRVKGEVKSGDMLDLTRDITALWKHSPSLYCVKLDVTMPTLSGAGQANVRQSMSQLPDLIRRELESRPDLIALWDRLLSEEEQQREGEGA